MSTETVEGAAIRMDRQVFASAGPSSIDETAPPAAQRRRASLRGFAIAAVLITVAFVSAVLLTSVAFRYPGALA